MKKKMVLLMSVFLIVLNVVTYGSLDSVKNKAVDVEISQDKNPEDIPIVI